MRIAYAASPAVSEATGMGFPVSASWFSCLLHPCALCQRDLCGLVRESLPTSHLGVFSVCAIWCVFRTWDGSRLEACFAWKDEAVDLSRLQGRKS